MFRFKLKKQEEEENGKLAVLHIIMVTVHKTSVSQLLQEFCIQLSKRLYLHYMEDCIR